MTFKGGYLTQKETQIWNLRKKIDNQSEIARKLGVSRQAISLSLISIETKMEKTFNEIIDANNLHALQINTIDGVMEAYSPAYNLPVIVSLSNTNGLKVWYLYEGNCEKCDLERKCRNELLEEAKEREVILSSLDKKLEPTKLARIVFQRYINEGKHNDKEN